MRHNTLSWDFYGKDIRDHSRISEFMAEAARLGFRGVQAQLRDHDYQADQPEFMEAMKFAKNSAHELGLQFWLNLDPRDATTSLLLKYPQARQRTVVPIESRLEDATYALSLDHSYTAGDHRTRCNYDYEAVERVFAFRVRPVQQVSKDIASTIFGDTGLMNWHDRRGVLETVDVDDVVDITRTATCVTNVETRVSSITGHWTPPSAGNWKILAFLRLSMKLFDYSSSESVEFHHSLVDLARESLGSDLDGVLSDEAGHAYPYHYLTPKNGYFVSEQFYSHFSKSCGYDLRDKLYGLVVETSNGTATQVRSDYFSELGSAMFRFQKSFKDHAIASFGPHLKVGIHYTAADWGTVDLQRGTLDYWRLTQTTTDGYTDGKNFDRYNAFFHVTLAKGLARLSDSKRGYTQTWDMFPNAPSDTYWSNVAALYGIRWEPMGYRERYYGYLKTPTVGAKQIVDAQWESWAPMNERMARLDDLTGGAPAQANVLAVFPMETIMRIGNEEAEAMRRVCHMLSYNLQTAQYQTDFTSAELLANATVSNGKVEIAGQHYDALVYPFPGCMPEETFAKIQELYEKGGKVLLFGCPPSVTSRGQDLGERFAKLIGIRPVTRMFDFIVPDLSTPRVASISFVRELADAPTVCIRDGVASCIPWHHYLWPILPTTASPVALNVRVERPGKEPGNPDQKPVWVGCMAENAAGGKLVFLGFDCSCVIYSDRLFDEVLKQMGVPKIVQGPKDTWTSVVQGDDRVSLLCCQKDGLGPVCGEIRGMGHTVEVDGAENVFAVTFDAHGKFIDFLAENASKVKVDGVDVLRSALRR